MGRERETETERHRGRGVKDRKGEREGSLDPKRQRQGHQS